VRSQAPSGADVVFDCIRVTWVAMIVSILFFNMDIANALWTGVIFGLGYTIFVRAMYRHQLRQACPRPPPFLHMYLPAMSIPAQRPPTLTALARVYLGCNELIAC